MRIVVFSDTHGDHEHITVPKGDVLIFAGDAEFRRFIDVVMFNDWLNTLPHKNKYIICGNHDFYGENYYYGMVASFTNAQYMENEGTILPNGMKMWASPYTNTFMDWAFMADDKQMQKYCDLIPDDVEVLVTHGPPYGILDIGRPKYGHVGSKQLAKRIPELKKLKYHIFGHIHGSAGLLEKDGITYVNCSVKNEDYDIVHKPIVLKV